MPALHAKKQNVHRFHLESLAVAAWFLFLAGGMITAEAASLTADRVIHLANQAREEAGLSRLSTNPALTRAAELKAADMAGQHYFAHTSPAGISPWHWFDEAGYTYRYAGENLAIHFTRAEDQQQAWMKSEKHRANILNPKYQETGVAVAVYEEDGRQSLVTVQLFGTLMDAPAVPTVAKPEGSVPQVASADVALADPVSARAEQSFVFLWQADWPRLIGFVTVGVLSLFALLVVTQQLLLRRVPVRSH